MFLCRRAGLEFAPLDPSPGTAWLPFPMFGHPRQGTENIVWDRSGDGGFARLTCGTRIPAMSARWALVDGSRVPQCRCGSPALGCTWLLGTWSMT
jgi:hypothetical protein